MDAADDASSLGLTGCCGLAGGAVTLVVVAGFVTRCVPFVGLIAPPAVPVHLAPPPGLAALPLPFPFAGRGAAFGLSRGREGCCVLVVVVVVAAVELADVRGTLLGVARDPASSSALRFGGGSPPLMEASRSPICVMIAMCQFSCPHLSLSLPSPYASLFMLPPTTLTHRHRVSQSSLFGPPLGVRDTWLFLFSNGRGFTRPGRESSGRLVACRWPRKVGKKRALSLLLCAPEVNPRLGKGQELNTQPPRRTRAATERDSFLPPQGK